jgi:hypothetical protein
MTPHLVRDPSWRRQWRILRIHSGKQQCRSPPTPTPNSRNDVLWSRTTKIQLVGWLHSTSTSSKSSTSKSKSQSQPQRQERSEEEGTEEVLDIRAWARQNSTLARKVLQIPPFRSCDSDSVSASCDDTSTSSTLEGGGGVEGRWCWFDQDHPNTKNVAQQETDTLTLTLTLLERYLQRREWAMTTKDEQDLLLGLGLDQVCDSDKQQQQQQTNNKKAAIGLVSSPLTYPLTVAYYWNRHRYRHKQQQQHQRRLDDSKSVSIREDTKTQRSVIKIAILGARAESTLTEQFWMEFLFASQIFSGGTTSMASSSSCSPPKTVHLDFIGPDVPQGMAPTEFETRLLHKPSEGAFRLKRSFFHGYFDDYLKMKSASVQQQHDNKEDNKEDNIGPPVCWDLVVLFNPGLGHSHLKSGWASTIEFLVQQGELPLLLTSFSADDSERDRNVILPLVEQFRPNLLMDSEEESTTTGSNGSNGNNGGLKLKLKLKYEPNPWASQMLTDDPFGPTTTVRPNHEVLFLP